MADMSDFTIEDYRMLAEAERKMDSGELPHVMWRGQRTAMTPETMTDFGFTPGQTIDDVLFFATARHNIARLETKIALENAAKGGSGV